MLRVTGKVRSPYGKTIWGNKMLLMEFYLAVWTSLIQVHDGKGLFYSGPQWLQMSVPLPNQPLLPSVGRTCDWLLANRWALIRQSHDFLTSSLPHWFEWSKGSKTAFSQPPARNRGPPAQWVAKNWLLPTTSELRRRAFPGWVFR